MNGIELSRAYFEEYGRPLLERDFASALPFLAAGFTGSGSEHYGFDDETSRDHDFEPGFIIFLPGEDVIDRRTEFLLERAYAKLPREFDGVKRLTVNPVGGRRSGVIRTADFYKRAAGTENGELSVPAWLNIPDYALSEAVNGELFFDNYGQVTAIRERLSAMPRDVLYKRLAGNLLIMAQAGQYNFTRCLCHGEYDAAQLAANEFVTAAIKCAFLLCGKYMPFYKWSFRALRELPYPEKLSSLLSYILKGDNADKKTAESKYDAIEEVAAMITGELITLDMTDAICGDLEKHAYSVNDKIEDGNIRNLNVLSAV